ncbi:hypothetical protein P170DRAFT_426928 [Aspergillus steynii IBT 23096]|uniref:F-box domain-containing protein n=1 Tax=Aspergillus steynii IBT 23096 TaxID=1392250 RepID=A0A2I2G494_9EURO|nr:uncharacterized protein P170DRAFT_426928 [Aspergillus steynii IBT 23096]PLB47697.1 hypothetical protein P170DRAFT_426928 [Aspergillus steynii IBT 23096]
MSCESVPLELWEMILDHLDLESTKALRLTSKTVSHLCSGRHFERHFRDHKVMLTSHGVQEFQALATHSQFGKLVENLTFVVGPDLRSTRERSDTIKRWSSKSITWVLARPDQDAVPEDTASLQEGSETESSDCDASSMEWSATDEPVLIQDDGKDRAANKQFFINVLEAFCALKPLRTITFWGGMSTLGIVMKGNQWDYKDGIIRRWEEVARAYYLVMAALVEARLVVDHFELYIDSPYPTSLLPALVSAPFMDFGSPASMTALEKLLGHISYSEPHRLEYRWTNFLKSLTTGADAYIIPLALRPRQDLSHIRTLRLNLYYGWHPDQTNATLSKLMQCLENITDLEHLKISDQEIELPELLKLLRKIPSVKHLELSRIFFNVGTWRWALGTSWGSWEPVLDLLATEMPHLKFLTLGHLEDSDRNIIALVRSWEDLKDFPEIQNVRSPSYGRTFNEEELAQGLDLVTTPSLADLLP